MEHPGATVSGRIDFDWGEKSRRIALVRSSPVFLRQEAVVESDGSFVFRGIRPGSYFLDVTSGHLWNRNPIVVKEKNLTGIHRVANRIGALWGTVDVKGADGSPAVPLEIRVDSRKIRMAVGIDRMSGMAYINLPTGSARITIVNLPREYRVESFTYGNTDILRDPVRIYSEIGVSHERFSLKLSIAEPARLHGLRGHVIGIENLSEDHRSNITLSGPSMVNVVHAPIQNDGSFAFSNLNSGTYNVEIGGRQRGIVRIEDKDIEGTDF